jgi:hypothetical protein
MIMHIQREWTSSILEYSKMTIIEVIRLGNPINEGLSSIENERES